MSHGRYVEAPTRAEADATRAEIARVTAAIEAATGATLFLAYVPYGPALCLTQLGVEPALRHEGRAEAALRAVIAYADAHGYLLTLTPEPGDRRTSKARLTRWYRRHGFYANKGRRRDFRFRDTMLRQPVG